MDTMYLDRTDKSCISVFMKDVEIVPAGTTVYSMPVKDKFVDLSALQEDAVINSGDML